MMKTTSDDDCCLSPSNNQLHSAIYSSNKLVCEEKTDDNVGGIYFWLKIFIKKLQHQQTVRNLVSENHHPLVL